MNDTTKPHQPIKNGFLGVLERLSEVDDAVTVERLTGRVTEFKSIPANGKRFKKGEKLERAAITYIGRQEDAKQFFGVGKPERVAFIVWVPRAELEEIAKAEGWIEEATTNV